MNDYHRKGLYELSSHQNYQVTAWLKLGWAGAGAGLGWAVLGWAGGCGFLGAIFANYFPREVARQFASIHNR